MEKNQWTEFLDEFVWITLLALYM